LLDKIFDRAVHQARKNFLMAKRKGFASEVLSELMSHPRVVVLTGVVIS
jgi:hypothetical protein